MGKYEFYYNLALGSCILSAITVVTLLMSVPMLYTKTSWDNIEFTARSEMFKVGVQKKGFRKKGFRRRRGLSSFCLAPLEVSRIRIPENVSKILLRTLIPEFLTPESIEIF